MNEFKLKIRFIKFVPDAYKMKIGICRLVIKGRESTTGKGQVGRCPPRPQRRCPSSGRGLVEAEQGEETPFGDAEQVL